MSDSQRIDPLAGYVANTEINSSLKTVSDFEESSTVQKNYGIVMDALARNKTVTSGLLDTAAYSDDGPAEFLRDITVRIGTKVNLATEAKDWSDEEKKAFNDLQKDFDNVSVTGLGEWATTIKDYGIDAVANLETIPAIASLIFQGGTGAAAAQVGSRAALSKTLAKVAAAAQPTTKTGFATYGAAFGTADDVALQNLEIGTGAREDYSAGQTLVTAGMGAVAGAGLKKGMEMFQGRNASKVAREAARKDLEVADNSAVPESEGVNVFEEGINNGTIPTSANDIMVDLEKLKNLTPEILSKMLNDVKNPIVFKRNQLVKELGGGEETVEEINNILLQAVASGATGEQVKSKMAHGLWKTATSLTGKVYGKAPGILTPYTKFSNSAKSLQGLLNYQFNIGYRTTEKIVGMDFSEVATRITGTLNNEFMAALEPIAMHSLTGEVEDSVNTALNLAVRGTITGNKKIDLAAKQIQNNLKKIGRQLKKEGLIQHEVENYVPRMWDRKAVEENQDALVKLLMKEKEAATEIEAMDIVAGMLDKENQLSAGTSGHFFSSKRVFDKIKDEASLAQFLNQDIRATMLSYNFQAGKSLAKKKVLGVTNEEQFINKWVNKINAEMGEAGQALTKNEKQDMVDLYRVATGENLERYGTKAQNAADAYQLTTRVALLGFATVSSLTEIMINLSKAGFRNTIKGFAEASEQSFKNVTKDLHSDLQSRHGLTANEAHRELQSVGVAMDQSMSQLGNRIAGDDLINEKMQQANNKFFRITMLDQWTKYVQRTSFAAGKNFIQDNIEHLAKHGNMPENRKTATLIGELNELGIDSKQATEWFNNGAKRSDEFYQTIINGAGRYTNQVILNPTAMSGLKPLLHSKPTTSILFGLMGYPAAFTNTVLKGAVQKGFQDPVRNGAKLAVTGLLMTETARMTNWIRSRGESEKDKSNTEIYGAAMARWGAFGIGADQLMRAGKTAEYTGKPGAALVTAPFGPIVGDAANLVLRGPAQVLGSKIPGSSMGNAIVGKESMQEFRKLTREMDAKLLDAITKDDVFKSTMYNTGGEVDVPNAPAEPDERINKMTGQPYNYEAGSAFMDADDPLKTLRSGFVLGGATKLATKALSALGQKIDDSTDNMFKPEIVENIAERVENIKYQNTTFDDPDLPAMYDDFELEELSAYVDGTVTSQLRERVGRDVTDDLADDFDEIGGGEFSVERGYTPEEIEEFEMTGYLADEFDMDGSLTQQINAEIQDLKLNHTMLNAENLDPVSEDAVEGMSKIVDYFSEVIKNEPVGANLTEAGTRKAARFQLAKLLNESEDLESIQDLIETLPGISVPKSTDEMLTTDQRALNFEAFLKDSQETNMWYRAVKGFNTGDSEIAFAFPRELGLHIGTSGQANFMAVKAVDEDVAINKFSVASLQGESMSKKEVQAFFDKTVKREGAHSPVSISRGYISVKNPLVLEEDMGTWAVDDILLNSTNRNNLIAAAREQGTLSKDAISNLNLLTREAEELMNFKLDIESMQYTYLEGAEEALTTGYKKSTTLPTVYKGLTSAFQYEIASARLTKDLQYWIKSQGFDSVKYRNTVESSFEGESDYSYILFEPQQYKTVNSNYNVKDRRQAYAEGGAVGSHKIKAGETLSSIANKYGTSVDALVALNSIEDANRIYADDVITLRSDAPAEAAPESPSIFEGASETVQQQRESLASQVDSAMSTVGQTVGEVQDAAAEAVEDTAEVATDVVEAVGETVTDAKVALSDTVESVTAGVSEGVEAVSTSISEGVEAAKEKGADLGATVSEGASAASSYFGDTVDDAVDAVKAGASSTLDKLKDMLSIDVMGDMTMDQVREANAPQEVPEATLPELRDLDFSASGRTAENMTGATAEPRETSLMGDMTTEQVREANAPEAPDLTMLEPTEEDIESVSDSNIPNINDLFNVPTVLRAYAGGMLSSGVWTEDILPTKELERLQEISVSNIKRGKTGISYSDYDSVGGKKVGYKMKTPDLKDPSINLKFTIGTGNLVRDGDQVVAADEYDFGKKGGIGDKGIVAKMGYLAESASEYMDGNIATYGLAHKIAEAVGPNPGEGPSIRVKLGTASELGLSEKEFNSLPTLENYTTTNKDRIKQRPVRNFLKSIGVPVDV